MFANSFMSITILPKHSTNNTAAKLTYNVSLAYAIFPIFFKYIMVINKAIPSANRK